MISALLALVLTLGPGGSFGSARRQPSPGSMGGTFEIATAVGTPVTTDLAEHGGTLTNIHGEATVAGTGLPGATLTLAVTADGVTKCSVVVACTEAGDFTGTCEDATFDAGQDLHLVITASTCITKPRLLARAAWLW